MKGAKPLIPLIGHRIQQLRFVSTPTRLAVATSHPLVKLC